MLLFILNICGKIVLAIITYILIGLLLAFLHGLFFGKNVLDKFVYVVFIIILFHAIKFTGTRTVNGFKEIINELKGNTEASSDVNVDAPPDTSANSAVGEVYLIYAASREFEYIAR